MAEATGKVYMGWMVSDSHVHLEGMSYPSAIRMLLLAASAAAGVADEHHRKSYAKNLWIAAAVTAQAISKEADAAKKKKYMRLLLYCVAQQHRTADAAAPPATFPAAAADAATVAATATAIETWAGITAAPAVTAAATAAATAAIINAVDATNFMKNISAYVADAANANAAVGGVDSLDTEVSTFLKTCSDKTSNADTAVGTMCTHIVAHVIDGDESPIGWAVVGGGALHNVLGGARRKGGAAESANTIGTLVDTLSKLGKTIDPGDSIHDTAHKLYIALKSFDVKQKDYSKICESARVAINKIMGTEVIKPSSDPVQLINNINDHLRALKEKHCGDFDIIKKDVERSVENLYVLMEMIQNAYDNAIAHTKADRSIMEATRPVLDHIRAEANRQISLLSEFLKVPARSVEATVESMRSEHPPDIIKKITKGSMSDRLSSILVGLGETGLLKARIETALTALGLKMGENAKSIGEAFLDKLEALKMSGALTDESIHKLAEAYKILEPLSAGNVINLVTGGFTLTAAHQAAEHQGGADQSAAEHQGGSDQSAAEHQGGADQCAAQEVLGGKIIRSMNKQIREKSTDYSSAMHAFRSAMNIYYDKLTFTLDQLAMLTLREPPKLTDDIDKFKMAIDKLDHLQSPVVFQALSGLHEDSDSIAVRDRFINYMRIVAERAFVLKPVSELYHDTGTIIADMITRIGQYAVIRPFKGGAEQQSDIEVLGAAEIAQKTGGKELFVADLPQDRTRMWRLADAIRKYIYYLHMQRIHKSMDFAESDIAQYNEDYANLVGAAVGKVLNEAQAELKHVLKTIDDLSPTDLKTITGNDDKPGAKEAMKKYHRRKYKKLVRTYKFAQRIDSYLLSFTDAAIKNRTLLENVFASLEATNYIANWMSEDSGDALVHAFENLPADKDRQTLPVAPITSQTIQPAGGIRKDADVFPEIQRHYYDTIFENRMSDNVRPLGDVTRPIHYTDVADAMDAFKKARQKSKAGKNLIQLFFKIGHTIAPERLGGFTAENEKMVNILGGFEDDDASTPAKLGGQHTGGAPGESAEARTTRIKTQLKTGAILHRTLHLSRNIKAYGVYDVHGDSMAKYELDDADELAGTLHTYTMNAIAGKIFAAIGLYNRTHDHTKNHGAADIITQTIFGRGQSVEVLPEAAELYLRLPLLAEFYHDLLGFGDTKESYNQDVPGARSNIGNPSPAYVAPLSGDNVNGSKITMVPDIDGTYAGLIKVIFARASANDTSPYSDNQVRELITCINAIYAKYKADGSTDAIGDAFRGLVREINRRIMIVKWTDVERYRKHKREYLQSRGDKEMRDSVDYDVDYPKHNKKHAIVPSDKFVDFAKMPKDQLSIADKMKIFKEFRTRLMSRLGGADPSHYDSFNSLMIEFRGKMSMAKDNTARFAEVLSLMGGLERGANTDVIKRMMFRECVVAPIEVMKFIYGQCRKFIDTIELLDISSIDPNNPASIAAFIDKMKTNALYGSRYISPAVAAGTSPAKVERINFNVLFYDLVNAIYQFGGDSRETVNISIEEGTQSCRFVLQFGKLQDAVSQTMRGIDSCITALSEQIPHEDITRCVGSSTSPGSLAFLRQYLLDEMLSDNYPRAEDNRVRSISDAVARANKIFAQFAAKWPAASVGALVGDYGKPQIGPAFKWLVYDHHPHNNGHIMTRGSVVGEDYMQVKQYDNANYYAYPTEYAGRFTGVIYNCNQIVAYLLDAIGDNRPFTGLISSIADNAVYSKKSLGNRYLGTRTQHIYYGNSDEIVFESNAARIHDYLNVSKTGKYEKSESELSKVGAYVKDTLTTSLPIVWRMSSELSKKCDFIKDLVRHGKFDLSNVSYLSRGYISASSMKYAEEQANLAVIDSDAKEATVESIKRAIKAILCVIRKHTPNYNMVYDPANRKLKPDGATYYGQVGSIRKDTSFEELLHSALSQTVDAAAGIVAIARVTTNGGFMTECPLGYADYTAACAAAREIYNSTGEDKDLDKYCRYDRAEQNWQARSESSQHEKYVLARLNSTGDVLYRISTACNETLTALSDNMLFGEHKSNFLVNYRSNTSKIPVSPLSWVLCGLRRVDPDCHKTYILPNESPTSEEYKYNRALRPLISPGISMTLDRCPYNEAMFADYDLVADAVNKIDKSQYADLMMSMATLSQYALFQKVYRSVFNNKPVQYAMYSGRQLPISATTMPPAHNNNAFALNKVTVLSQYLGQLPTAAEPSEIDVAAHDYKMYNGWRLYKDDHMPPPAEDLFDYAEQTNQQKALHYLTKAKSRKVLPDRSKLRVYNILDMGVAPINLNVLRREIPFVNIYNYHLGFVDMMHEFLDIGKSAHYDLELANTRLSRTVPPTDDIRRQSIRYNDAKLPHRLLYKLIQDPYAIISDDEYNHLGTFIKGNTDLPRPLYISDQLWNKCLLNRVNDIRIPIEANGATMTRYPASETDMLLEFGLPLPTNNVTLARVVIPTPPPDNVHTYVNNHVIPQELREMLRPLYMTYLTDESYTGGAEQDDDQRKRKTRTCGLLFLKDTQAYQDETGNNFGSAAVPVAKCIGSMALQTAGCREMVSAFARVGKVRFDMLLLRRLFHKHLLHYVVLQKLARELFSSASPVVRGIKMVAPARLGYASPYDAWRDNSADSSIYSERRRITDSDSSTGRYVPGVANPSMR